MKSSLFRIIDLCQSHQIDNAFVQELHHYGLIQITLQDSIEYLHEDQIANFEKYNTWHHELELNIQSIEVVERLLLKIESLQQELRQIKTL